MFEILTLSGGASDAAKDDASDVRWFVGHVITGAIKRADARTLFSIMAVALFGGRRRLATAADGAIKFGRLADAVMANRRSYRVLVRPPPDFDEAAYLSQNPDVAEAVRRGAVSCGFVHYVKRGRTENRLRPYLPGYALARNDEVVRQMVGRVAVIFGRTAAERAAGYFKRYGLVDTLDVAGLPAAVGIGQWVEEMRELSVRRPQSVPQVSVVVPVYNHLRETMACIHSLLELETKIPFEIIVADDASTDDTPATFSFVIPGIRHVRGESNRGFIANCNAGAAVARGDYVVFLNNDTIVLPGWLDELVSTLKSNSDIGLVGSRFLSSDGLLQEAGGIIWRDGSAWNYGRGKDPLHPDFSYMRDVDYVSGASIMLPRELWRELGGFDDWYEIAYGEDSDLAFRVRKHGKRVVYQPLSTLIHLEGVSSGTDTSKGVKSHQVENARKLYSRWKQTLQSHRPSGEDPVLERERNISKRVLVIDARTPAPDEDAGSLTCYELMRAFQANGYKVNFMPRSNLLYMPKETGRLQRLGIEAIYAPHYLSHEAYLKAFGWLFDVVLMFRHESAFPLLASVRQHAPQAKIMFHVSDLHFVRESRKADLDGILDPTVERTQKRELYCVRGADLTIVHSEFERDVLKHHAPVSQTYVFPWILDNKPAGPAFGSRRDISFLGGYQHRPNVDAVEYFVREIWPRIHAQEPDMVFHAIGSHCPDELQRLHGRNNVNVIGFVDDLDRHFDQIRISVAPIRYGAGIKGKVAMAMSYGVPVVTTVCGAEGMGLKDGENVLVRDDPASFADAVIQLYRDDELWNRLSSASRDFIDRGYSRERGGSRVAEMLDIVSCGRQLKRTLNS